MSTCSENPWKDVADSFPLNDRFVDVWVVSSELSEVGRLMNCYRKDGVWYNAKDEPIEDDNHHVLYWMERPFAPLRYGMI